MLCPKCKRSFPPSRRLCPTDGVELVPEGDETYAWGVQHQDETAAAPHGPYSAAPPNDQGPYQPGPDVPAGAEDTSGTAPLRPISLLPAEPRPAPPPPAAVPPPAPGTAHPESLIPSPFDAIPFDADLDDPSLEIASQQLEPGQMVDEYRITGLLGEGGMGTVYDAVQPLIGTKVAIKVLLQEFSANEKVIKRFIQEARAVNQIRSRYIVYIFSFGRLENGRPYLVMEHLDGTPLRDFIKERGTLLFDEAFAILRCVCKGLAAAHSEGIVHRDLKPENIMVLEEEDGVIMAKILDFGIAKLQTGPGMGIATQTGVAMGTPYYMSPEQVRGVDVDQLSDIYALGIIMFEMFTGSLPFTANSYIELVNKHLFTAPPIPSKLNDGIPRELEALILSCVEKEKAGRPQSMKELLEVLVSLAPHATGMTFPSLAAQPAQPEAVATIQQQGQVPAQGPVQAPAQTPALVAEPSVPGAAPPVAPAAAASKKSRAGLWIGLLAVLLLLGGGGAGAGYYFVIHRAGGLDLFLASLSGESARGTGGKGGAGGSGTGRAVGTGTGAAAGTPAGQGTGSGSAAVDAEANGSLQINTRPTGATVFLDDRKQPATTPLGIGLAPGSYTVRVELAGHLPLSETVKVRAKQEKSITLSLVPSAGASADMAVKGARLTVTVNHPRARFFLDDKLVGQGRKLKLENIPPGTHVLRVTAPGRQPKVRQVEAVAGAIQAFDLALKRKAGPRPGQRKGGRKNDTKPRRNQDDPDKTLDPFSKRRR